MLKQKEIQTMCMQLANRECANNYDGFCVWGDCACHAAADARFCKYFNRNVLPGYPDVQARCYIAREAQEDVPFRLCEDCGEPFFPTKPRQIFCEDCARRRRQENTRRRVRMARERAGNVTPENPRTAI